MSLNKPSGQSDIQGGVWEGQWVKYRPHRIIVKFNPTTQSLRDLSEILVAIIPGGRLIRLSQKTGRVIYDVAKDTDIIELASKLSIRDDVNYAEPDIVDSTA